MKHFLLAASHRADSYNRRLARLSEKALSLAGDEVDHLEEYAEFCLPPYDDCAREHGEIPPQVEVIAERIAAADSLVIAMPEYNWSLPGSLKNTLDWLSHYRPIPLSGKASLLMSATPGKRGGVMGLSHLKTVLEALGVYVHPVMFPLGNAPQILTEAGLTDEGGGARFERLIADYRRFAHRLAQ